MRRFVLDVLPLPTQGACRLAPGQQCLPRRRTRRGAQGRGGWGSRRRQRSRDTLGLVYATRAPRGSILAVAVVLLGAALGGVADAAREQMLEPRWPGNAVVVAFELGCHSILIRDAATRRAKIGELLGTAGIARVFGPSDIGLALSAGRLLPRNRPALERP